MIKGEKEVLKEDGREGVMGVRTKKGLARAQQLTRCRRRRRRCRMRCRRRRGCTRRYNYPINHLCNSKAT